MEDNELDKIYKKAFEDYLKRQRKRNREKREKAITIIYMTIIMADLLIIGVGAFLTLTAVY